MIEKYIAYYKSKIGRIKIVSSKGMIVFVEFAKKNKRKSAEPYILKKCIKQVDEYFKGKRKNFSIDLQLEGTAFQKGVWRQLAKIPFGRTVSYKDIAAAIGNKNAVRAVANAIGKNKISIIIPCHRVIGSNGKPTGYGGGIWRKEWLLRHEKPYN